jgi:hypothetical protein
MNRSLIALVLAAPTALAACGSSSHDVAAPAAAQAPTAPVANQKPAMAGMHDDGMGDGMMVADAKPATVAKALDFSAQTTDGATFSGASLAGHAAVLWFWAPGCAECVKLAPAVLAAERANPGVHFVGIAGLADAGAMRKDAASMHIDGFTQLADLRGALWRKFGVTSQPAFAFIDREGKVTVHKGGMGGAELAHHTAALA